MMRKYEEQVRRLATIEERKQSKKFVEAEALAALKEFNDAGTSRRLRGAGASNATDTLEQPDAKRSRKMMTDENDKPVTRVRSRKEKVWSQIKWLIRRFLLIRLRPQ
jgi:hypothetical protein